MLPPATSLSALAQSKGPGDSAVSPAGAVHRTRGLGRIAALGAGLSFLLVAGFAGSHAKVQTPHADVLHAAPGVKQTPDGKQVRWRKKSTTVYIDASVDQLGPGVRHAIQGAFGTWLETGASLPRLTFDSATGLVTQPKPDGKNSVVFAPITLPGHERDLAITLTYSDEKTGDILESDIVINRNFPFEVFESTDQTERRADGHRGNSLQDGDDDSDDKDSDDETADSVRVSTAVQTERRSSCVAQQVQSSCGREVYDVANVMTHEVGHFFGLGEDMSDTSATMYVCTNRCETHKRELATADAGVLTALYLDPIPELDQSTAAGCNAARIAPRGASGIAGISALLAALVLRSRRRGG